jgi:adenylate kinase
VDKVIFLNVSDKEALWRLSGRLDNREDETLAAIRKRIEMFHEWTLPVLEYYKKQRQLATIDGEQEVKQVFQDIMRALKLKK